MFCDVTAGPQNNCVFHFSTFLLLTAILFTIFSSTLITGLSKAAANATGEHRVCPSTPGHFQRSVGESGALHLDF